MSHFLSSKVASWCPTSLDFPIIRAGEGEEEESQQKDWYKVIRPGLFYLMRGIGRKLSNNSGREYEGLGKKGAHLLRW